VQPVVRPLVPYEFPHLQVVPPDNMKNSNEEFWVRQREEHWSIVGFCITPLGTALGIVQEASAEKQPR